jgi:hypothetical protein
MYLRLSDFTEVGTITPINAVDEAQQPTPETVDDAPVAYEDLLPYLLLPMAGSY